MIYSFFNDLVTNGAIFRDRRLGPSEIASDHSKNGLRS